MKQLTKIYNNISTETRDNKKNNIHSKDNEAFTLLTNNGLELTDVCDKIKNVKSYHTQFINTSLNYTGGKYELLPLIRLLVPQNIDNLYDVFGGGGSVGVNINASKIIYNEIDNNIKILIENLSKKTAQENYDSVMKYIIDYKLDDIVSIKNHFKKFKWETLKPNKTFDYYNIYATSNVEYIHRFKYRFQKLKDDFNNSKIKKWELIYLLCIFAFDNVLSYNKNNEVNSSFNERNFSNSLKAKFLVFSNELIKKSSKYTFINGSYSSLLTNTFSVNDYVYLDSPYFISANQYTRKYWKKEQEIKYITDIEKVLKKNVKFGISNVIFHKNKINHYLIDFINNNKLYVHYIPKDYTATSKKTDKENTTVEVFITNYPTLICDKHTAVSSTYNKEFIDKEKSKFNIYSQNNDYIQGQLVDANNIEDTVVEYFDLVNKAEDEANKHQEISLNLRLDEIKYRKYVGVNGTILKAKYKGKKGEYGQALKRIGIKDYTMRRHMSFVKDERIMKLTDEELLKIPNLTFTKLFNMTKLNDEEFKKVLEGNKTILKKKKKVQKPIQSIDKHIEQKCEIETHSNPNDNEILIDELRATIKIKDNIIKMKDRIIKRYERYSVGSAIPCISTIHSNNMNMKQSA